MDHSVPLWLDSSQAWGLGDVSSNDGIYIMQDPGCILFLICIVSRLLVVLGKAFGTHRFLHIFVPIFVIAEVILRFFGAGLGPILLPGGGSTLSLMYLLDLVAVDAIPNAHFDSSAKPSSCIVDSLGVTSIGQYFLTVHFQMVLIVGRYT